MKKQEYMAIGLMSGTSLDGLDIALCSFAKASAGWCYRIVGAETYPYSREWKENLSTAHLLDGESLTRLDREYGKHLGDAVLRFLEKTGTKPDFVASHGHTVFHRPDRGYTLQIGSGSELAARINIPVVFDFRSADIALGGQGAPLVPAGDELLFGEFAACLNIGGFANISFRKDEMRRAFDICPVNTVLNLYAQKIGLDYDKDGKQASRSAVRNELLERLNRLAYYQQQFPKSLGREWLSSVFLPEIEKELFPADEILATVTRHAAVQITDTINKLVAGNVLITGGGAFNKYLMKQLISGTNTPLVLPEPDLVNFKEALVFAFMGVLRMRGDVNCMSSVTGARTDSVGGVVAGV